MEEKKFDPKRKFVRVTELRENGLVEFDFAIGEPELFAEMILPAAAFDEFCAANKVTFVDERSRLVLASAANGENGEDSADNEWNWSLRDATHQRFKHGA